MTHRLIQKLRRDERGAALMEFAILAPVLLMVIMGLLDLAHMSYMKSILAGEVQKAARDSTLESATNSGALGTIDAKIKARVKNVNGTLTDANFTITRRNFTSFSDAGKMEPTTGPGNVCAVGYTYVDRNDSGTWDDGAQAGAGGAQDVTLYTVRVTYPPLLPIKGLWGGEPYHSISASTVLRNQPYKDQQARNAGVTKSCV